MGQIERFNHLVYLKPFNDLRTNDLCLVGCFVLRLINPYQNNKFGVEYPKLFILISLKQFSLV